MRRIRALIGTIVVLALIAGGPFCQRAIFYPQPPTLPPVVPETIPALLARLQSVLEKQAPEVAESWQPGLSNAQISILELRNGFRLSEELRSLYLWHDGADPRSQMHLLPGHRFLALEEIARERSLLSQQMQAASLIQRFADLALTAHRRSWLPVFEDGAGDGYFFDPDRTAQGGAFFFSHCAIFCLA